jgi:MFS family permease
MAGSLLIEALKSPSIRSFVLGTFMSNIGTWIQRVTIGFLVFEATHSAAWVGAVAACEVLPSLLVAPFAGVALDRSNRVKLFLWGQSLAQLQAVALALLALADLLSVNVLVAAAIALGLIDGVNQPTRLTLMGEVATGRLVGGAVALNSFGFNAARFIGPAVAGITLASGGPFWAFLLNAASFVPLLVVLIRMGRSANTTLSRIAAPAQDGIVGGIRHIATHTILAPIFVMLMGVAVLARPLFDLLPAISGAWFDGTPERLASLTASIGLGALASGAWMLQRGSLSSMLSASITLPGVMIAAVFLFAACHGYWLAAYPLLVIAGFAAIACGVGMQAVIHAAVDPAYRGRVLSTYGLVQRALPAIGAFMIGSIGDYIGLRVTLLACSAIATLIWLAIWRNRATLQREFAVIDRGE